eukprot:CAMPEP_0113839010 /NCGR_PEP_ID=MMETSP0328-20130328/10850_1 /TAXON_ID=39455 /ORGANISM="Alexandrium minutum" /LENGTH=205 /DNA_ID=CAMNT_0000807593 /DNA_START=175 /DNA_END=790 /DNA_ORIENTATION=- /assembly_acc=CAM_ASM_000350
MISPAILPDWVCTLNTGVLSQNPTSVHVLVQLEQERQCAQTCNIIKAIATRGIAESALRAEVGNGLRWVVATRAVRGAAQRNRCLVATRGSRRASECTTPEAAALVAWGRQALDVAVAGGRVATEARGAEVRDGLVRVVAARAVGGAAQRCRCLIATQGPRRAGKCTTPEAAALVAWGRQALDVAVAGGRVATEARGAEVRDGLA